MCPVEPQATTVHPGMSTFYLLTGHLTNVAGGEQCAINALHMSIRRFLMTYSECQGVLLFYYFGENQHFYIFVLQTTNMPFFNL